MSRRSICIIALLLLQLAAARSTAGSPAPTSAPPAPASKNKIDFNRDVRPILSDNCYYCHGPDKSHRKAELRLDLKDGLFGERDDTFPVVPGKPDDSVLYMRI